MINHPSFPTRHRLVSRFLVETGTALSSYGPGVAELQLVLFDHEAWKTRKKENGGKWEHAYEIGMTVDKGRDWY